MKKNYDFPKGLPNPYAKRLKTAIRLRVDDDTLA